MAQIDPLELIMIGDLTDIVQFTDFLNQRYRELDSAITIHHNTVGRLLNRRQMNGGPEPVLKTSANYVYLHSQLLGWFESYVITHPNFRQGSLRAVVIKLREAEVG